MFRILQTSETVDSVGTMMAAQAVGPLADPVSVSASITALTGDLLAVLSA